MSETDVKLKGDADSFHKYVENLRSARRGTAGISVYDVFEYCRTHKFRIVNDIPTNPLREHPNVSPFNTKYMVQLKEMLDGAHLVTDPLSELRQYIMILKFTANTEEDRNRCEKLLVDLSKTPDIKKLPKLIENWPDEGLRTKVSQEAEDLFQSSLKKQPPVLVARGEIEDKIRRIGHVLALKGERYEGYHISGALHSFKERFKTQPVEKEMEHYTAPRSAEDWKKSAADLKRVAALPKGSHLNYAGILGGWEGHAYSVHAVRDNDKVHFIYLNRGQRDHSDYLFNPPPQVKVFTFSCHEQEKISTFVEQLTTTMQQERRSAMRDFLRANKGRDGSRNLDLPDSFKSFTDQTVGNCSFANSNTALRFMLAAQYVEKNPHVDFFEADRLCKQQYIDIRKNDRAQAFCDLLELRQQNPKNTLVETALKDAMDSFSEKAKHDGYMDLIPQCVKAAEERNLLFTLKEFESTHSRSHSSWKTNIDKSVQECFDTIKNTPDERLMDSQFHKHLQAKLQLPSDIDYKQFFKNYIELRKHYEKDKNSSEPLVKSIAQEMKKIIDDPISFLKDPTSVHLNEAVLTAHRNVWRFAEPAAKKAFDGLISALPLAQMALKDQKFLAYVDEKTLNDPTFQRNFQQKYALPPNTDLKAYFQSYITLRRQYERDRTSLDSTVQAIAKELKTLVENPLIMRSPSGLKGIDQEKLFAHRNCWTSCEPEAKKNFQRMKQSFEDIVERHKDKSRDETNYQRGTDGTLK